MSEPGPEDERLREAAERDQLWASLRALQPETQPRILSPTPLVLFETFRMTSWPHFDRLSTKRWMLRFYFM